MREKNIKIIIIVLIVIIALLSILGILLYFFTDMFKTNETLFKKYFAQ